MKKNFILGFLFFMATSCTQKDFSPTQNQATSIAITPLPSLPPTPKPKCLPTPITKQPKVIESKTFGNGNVEFQGISFTYNPMLATSVIAETKAANPLACEDDKPDYDNYPEHQVFRLKGDYAESYNDENSWWVPEIRIYPIREYKKTFLVGEPENDQYFPFQVLKDLEISLLTQPKTFDGEAPFTLFLDAHQKFTSQVRYINFKSGKAIAYVTEYGIDMLDVITNNGLMYIFQGITTDNRYLVSATFPIKVPFLPKDEDALAEKDWPFDPRNMRDDPATRKRVAQHIARIKNQFERLPEGKATPSLRLFNDLIQSLSINKPLNKDSQN